MIWGDSYDGGCSSGQAFNIPNDTFIVTVGPKCNWNTGDNTNVGTFVHELGHNIGLKHGGTDNLNYKPNYLSVMNCSFQLGGVLKADGSTYWGYSTVAPPALNEASLNESAGLGSTASAFRTSWKCPNGTTRTTTGAASGPIDWNCDGDNAADINDDNVTSSLTAQNNWANIVFGGGAVGQGSTVQAKTPASELRELTHDEWISLRHLWPVDPPPALRWARGGGPPAPINCSQTGCLSVRPPAKPHLMSAWRPQLTPPRLRSPRFRGPSR